MERKLFYNDITIIKLLATFFITWFHFKGVVPESLAPLFIGGAIGNSCFFYASGYLLSFKPEKYRGQWLVNKYVRIMPSVWIFSIVMLAATIGGVKWYNFLYPTQFWFVNCILCYFLIVYLVRKLLDTKKGSVILCSTLLCVYFGFYHLNVDHTKIVMDEGGFKCWFFFFFFFLWGYYDKRHKTTCVGTWRSILWLVVAICLFFLYKKVGCKDSTLLYLQFIFIPVCLFVVVYFVRYVANFIASWPLSYRTKKVFSLLSDMTLDIYIVQIVIIDLLGMVVPFPLSIVLLMLSILIAAYVNNYVAQIIRKGLTKILP